MKRSLIKLFVFFSLACCIWCGVIKVAGNDSKSYWDAKSREVNQNVEHDRARFIALWVVLSVVFGVPIVLCVMTCFVLAGIHAGKEREFISAA